MKPTTGFFTLALMYSAAFSSAVPPISPIMMPIASVRQSGSAFSSGQSVDMGRPDDQVRRQFQIAVDCPIPRVVNW